MKSRLLYLIFLVQLTNSIGQSTPLSCDQNVIASATLERVEAQSAVVNGKLYVFAGFLEGLRITDVTEIYDPILDSWSFGAPMPVPVTHMGIAVVGTDVWILGGFVGNHPGTATDLVQIYNTVTDSWKNGIPLPSATGSGAAVYANSKVHFFGGLEPDRQTDVEDHYMIDTSDIALGWVPAPPLPEPRNHLSAAAISGKIYAIGGQTGHDVTFSDKNFLHCYDPITEVWEEKASLPTNRSHFEPGTTVYQDKILIAGGRNGPIFFDTILSYDPSMDIWSTDCGLTERLLAPVAKVIGDQLIVANGGVNGTCCPTNTAQKIMLSDNTLGIPNGIQDWAENLILAPNPVSEILTITNNQKTIHADIIVNILDLQGKVLIKENLENISTTLEVAYLPKGIFLVQFLSNNTIISIKKLHKQ